MRFELNGYYISTGKTVSDKGMNRVRVKVIDKKYGECAWFYYRTTRDTYSEYDILDTMQCEIWLKPDTFYEVDTDELAVEVLARMKEMRDKGENK